MPGNRSGGRRWLRASGHPCRVARRSRLTVQGCGCGRVDCGRALSASAFAGRRHVELSWARAARRGLRGLRELQAGVCFSICMGRSVGRSIYMGRFVALALTLAMAVDSDSKPVARVIITVPIIVAAATVTVVVAGAG